MADERPRVDYDKPPFSRVFVVCSRSHTEEELREAFEEHGVVSRQHSKKPCFLNMSLIIICKVLKNGMKLIPYDFTVNYKLWSDITTQLQ